MSDRARIDLHVHTALSPCGADEMRPPEVLLTAERAGIDVLGIVDHSTARNARAFFDASEAFNVRVFVGLEVESAEGVHILALFDTEQAAMEMDAVVTDHLPSLANDPDIFGEQHLLDEFGDRIGTDDRLLLVAADLSIERVVQLCSQLGGMAIPAHVNRPLNGLLPTLGFVPTGLKVDALEISAHMSTAQAIQTWPELSAWPLMTSSDAHCLADIGRAVTVVSQDLAQDMAPAVEWVRKLAHELRTGSV